MDTQNPKELKRQLNKKFEEALLEMARLGQQLDIPRDDGFSTTYTPEEKRRLFTGIKREASKYGVEE